MTRLELLWIPLRVLPLPVTAAFLAVLHGPAPTRPADWVLGLTAAALTGLGGRFPVAATLIQSALLVLGGWVDARTALPMMFILTMITLGELWVRRDGWRCWAGAAAFAAAQVLLYAPYFDPLLSTSSLVVTTAPPVLLGVYVRAVLRTALDAERRRDEAVRDARLAERIAIARELHDLVAHHMASIAVQVGAARHTLGGANPRVDEALAQAHTSSRAALTDLKQLMTVLRDPAADTATVADSLPAALAAVVDRTRATGVTVDADLDGAVAGLDSMRRLAVLRVVQEGLTNVVKHAGPHARARLVVAVSPDAVRITVTDDGPTRPATRTGFVELAERTMGGVGLVGLRERIELLGGHVRAGGGTAGWVLEATIPASAEP